MFLALISLLYFFYRPPNSGHAPLDTLFSTLCNTFLLCSSNLYLIGDFNVDFLSKVSPLYSKLLSIVSSFDLTQIVSEPTRITPHSTTLIDLIFVSSVDLVKFCKTISPLANADHCGLQLLFTIKSPKTSEKAVPRKVWRYSLADWQKAAEMIECIEWDSILPRDVDKCWKEWKSCFLQVMELCIPHTTAKLKRNLPWLNKDILNAIKKRDTLFRTAKATGKSCDRERYNQKRNQVVSMLRESKQSFFDNNLNQTDVKTFWKTVRLLNRDYSSSIPTLCDGATTADTNLDKATLLNNYFYTCFNHEQPPLQQLPDLAESLLPPAGVPSDFLCTEESVLELLSELDTTKSTGHDGISSQMLKFTSSSIADSLHKLFNRSLSTGIFPSDWKLGRITAIPKGSNRKVPSGYRPISVLPIVSKLIERHVKTIIMEFLKENSPISTRQWGFMANRSTISALIKVIDDWSKALDQGYEVCVIFFDVSKAFDTVPHSPLLAKLHELSFDPYLLRWIKSYLTNRSQYVCVDGVTSSILPVLSGVPQGSVLGPLLFIIYINDVATVISPTSDANMFADDIALYRVIKTTSDYVHLQEDINSVSHCIHHKQLQFNASKCKMMLISKKTTNSIQPPQLTLNGTVLTRVYNYKYLGVTITADLSWTLHISNCCNKTRKLTGLLYRRFHQHASSPTLLKLYCSFIRPHLEYASIVWNPGLKGNIDELEDVQKFALRVCFKSWELSYSELLTNARLPSLEQRRLLASLCHLFKILQGFTDFDNAPLQSRVNLYNTRSSNKPILSVPAARTNYYQHSFFPNIISMWNSLPREATECKSILCFKRYVNSFLES